MITKRPWFEPKRIGWGWRPVSWEGWLATTLCAGAAVASNVALGRSLIAVCATLGAVALLLVICVLTGTPSR